MYDLRVRDPAPMRLFDPKPCPYSLRSRPLRGWTNLIRNIVVTGTHPLGMDDHHKERVTQSNCDEAWLFASHCTEVWNRRNFGCGKEPPAASEDSWQTGVGQV